MQDSKFLWHKAEEKRDESGNILVEAKDWHLVELHATDAMHALDVDPDHWKTEKPGEPVEVVADSSETEQTGEHE